MRAISRICGNERQGSISAALSVLFPELLLVIEPTRPTTSRKAGYAPESANILADIVNSVMLTFVVLRKLKERIKATIKEASRFLRFTKSFKRTMSVQKFNVCLKLSTLLQ